MSDTYATFKEIARLRDYIAFLDKAWLPTAVRNDRLEKATMRLRALRREVRS